MALSSLDLIVDVTSPSKTGILQSFDNNLPADFPTFVRNDEIPVTLRAVRPSKVTNRPWDDIDLSAAETVLAIGEFDGVPTSGGWTATYGANTTGSLSFDISAAALQTALNLLASIISAGGVTVTEPVDGFYLILFNVAGSRTAFSTTYSGLSPASVAVVSEIIAGDGSTYEQQSIQLVRSPYAMISSWSFSPVASATITQVTAGTVSSPETQQIELDPPGCGGTIQITTDLLTTDAIPFNGTEAQVLAALNRDGENYVVTGPPGGPWAITTVALGNVAPFTVNVSNLLVPKYLIGSLDLSTYSMFQRFIGVSTDAIELKLEAEVTEAGRGPCTILQKAVSVSKDVINLSRLTPIPLTDYYTAQECDINFIHNQSAITGFIGGLSTDFDSITTNGKARLQLHAAVIGGDLYIWRLQTGTAATNSPFVIRPTDYDGSTNQANWILIGSTRVNAYETASYSSAGTTQITISPFIKNYIHKAVVSAGSGSFTRNLDLEATDRLSGDVAEVLVVMPASDNPTIVVRDGVANASLIGSGIVGTGSVFTSVVRSFFDGTNWQLLTWV